MDVNPKIIRSNLKRLVHIAKNFTSERIAYVVYLARNILFELSESDNYPKIDESKLKFIKSKLSSRGKEFLDLIIDTMLVEELSYVTSTHQIDIDTEPIWNKVIVFVRDSYKS